MSSFDYDVIVIGSGFGGRVAALRAVEKGYSVAIPDPGGSRSHEGPVRQPIT